MTYEKLTFILMAVVAALFSAALYADDYPSRPITFVAVFGPGSASGRTRWCSIAKCAREVVKRAGQKASLPFQVHAHMLRHAAGYKLAGDGHDTRSIQDYLGHKNIQHTVRYTELSPTRFKDFWRN